MFRKTKSWWLLTAVNLAALLFIVAIIEMLPLFPPDPLLARYADPNAPPKLIGRHIRLKEHLPNQAREITPPERYLQGTDTLEARPFVFETDANGFIKPSTPHDDPDITIAFLGGSTTETLYVDPEVRFPYLAGKKIEDALGTKVNSINSGVSGNHSMHSNFILLSKVVPLRPDFAVMMHVGNDLGTLLHLGSYWNDNPYRSIVENETQDPTRLVSAVQSIKSFIYASLPNTTRALKRAATRIRDAISPREDDPDLPPPEEDEFAAVRGKKVELEMERFLRLFRESLQTFVDTCRAWGITPVLMTQANRMTEEPDALSERSMRRLKKQGLGYEVMRDANLRFQEAVRDVAADNGILLIDLHARVPQTNTFMYDGMHYNNRGSEKAAEIVVEALMPAVRERLARQKAGQGSAVQ